jgi:hypothetical protein
VVNQGLTPEVLKKGFGEWECPAVGIVVYVGEGKEGHEIVLANIRAGQHNDHDLDPCLRRLQKVLRILSTLKGSTSVDRA